MSERPKTDRLFHKIKHRNSVDPNVTPSEWNFKAFSPLTARRRRHRVIQYMHRIIQRTYKSKERRAKVTPLHYISSSSHFSDVQEFCRNCPTTPMPRFLEKEILRRVSVRAIQGSYKTLLQDIMADAREQFLEITHRSGIGMKVKTDEDRLRLTPYKYLGRTSNYQFFLSRRADLSRKFLLHHPLIKRILYECVTNLPYELFNLNHWLKCPVGLREFHNQFLDMANDASQCLQQFYKKIVSLVECAQIDRRQNINSFIGACTGILSVNLSRTIAHTLLHVVNFTASKDHTPYLQLNITFKDRLILEPTADDVVDIYTKFLKRIVTFVNQFPVLEKYKLPSSSNKNIYLCLTDEFFNSCLERIDQNIKEKYTPISQYIRNLESDFVDIYDDISSGGDMVSTNDLVFEEGCSRILYYRSYLDKVVYIPDNTYFDIGPLNLTEYRETLRRTLNTILSNIFDKLSAQHEWEVNDICEAFEIINIRAVQKAITTEELIETGKYMAWVQTEYLDELKERVMKALEYLTKLILLGPLTDTHIATNSKAINWIDQILPVLESNNAVYEQLKFEAEEKLQRIIEEINVDIKDVYPLLSILDSMDDIRHVQQYLKSINLHLLKIKEIENKIEWINSEEVSLSFPKSVYAEFEELKNYVYPFYHLLKLCLDTRRNLSVWLDGQFDLIKYEDTKKIVEKYHAELMTTHKVYRGKLRQAQDENLSLRFKGTVDDPDMLNWPAPLKLCSKAINLIQDFEPCLTVIKIMCNEALTRRHWKEMSKVAGFDITPNAGTTLRKITKIDIKSNLDKYEIISIAATEERALFANLNKMYQEWANIQFVVRFDHKIEQIAELEDIERTVDDHLIQVKTMLNSVYVKPFHSEVKDFHEYLLKTRTVLEQIRNIQFELLHLLPLLSTKEIATQVQYEADLFEEVKAIYKNYITQLSSKPNVRENVSSSNLLEELFRCSEKLEVINKGVVDYCEKARQNFHRLYFISNDELFLLLSETEKPVNTSRYLKHIFPGVSHIGFDDSFGEILSVQDRWGERSFFVEPICIEHRRARVDQWLSILGTNMNLFISNIINTVLEDYQRTELKIWLGKWPLQALLVASKILFTANSQKAITNKSQLNTYNTTLRSDLNYITGLITTTDSSVNNLLERKLKSIVVLNIHSRDILESLIDCKVESDKDFEWLVQFRYYSVNGDCVVNILESSIEYGNEYLGSIDQIVITPSVERCHRSLIVAYNFNLFGMCEGATGTGKSEAAKGLAQTLGMHYVYFNCPEQMNYKVIANLLKGVFHCGSWLYLNNFKQLDFKTVSVLSQDVYKISSFLKARWRKRDEEEAVLGSTQTDLKHCFICISIERSFKEIPENFKTLFRTVAMTPPDHQVIAEVILCSSGFKHSKILSNRTVAVQQLLYDSGLTNRHDLRTIKQIVRSCSEKSGNDEEQIVYRAIRNANITNLPHSVMISLDTILSKYFPSVEFQTIPTNNCRARLTEICRNKGLHPTEKFLDKIAQLSEVTQHKNGVIITGETMTGKTEVIKIVKDTVHSANITSVNPKSVTMRQLYGYLDPKLDRWVDGIITECFRNGSQEHQWLIFDGPIDCVWAENLNSVLDDNKKLCLGSGEAVAISDGVLVIFETHTLEDASPALISRCGLVHVDSRNVGWEALIKCWISNNRFPWATDLEDNILTIFTWIVPPCLEFIRKNCCQLYKINDLCLIKTMTVLMELFLNDACNNSCKKEDDLKNIVTWIQATFLQAGVWAFGSTLDHDSRVKFDEFYKQLWRGLIPSHPYPGTMEKLEVSVPQEGMIFDYMYLYKLKGNWRFWPDTLKNEKLETSDYSADMFVPTVDTMKYMNMINMHVTYNYPVLIVGGKSTGKSLYLRNLRINRLPRHKYEPLLLNYTSRITVSQIQSFVLSKLNKVNLNRYTPAPGKSCVLLIDDLNVTVGDNFGTHPPIEFLRQILGQKSCYDGTKQSDLDNFNIIGTTSLGNSSNQQLLCPRFLRHFNVFYLNDICEDNVVRIFSTTLLTHWRKIGVPNDIVSTANHIVSATYRIYKFVLNHFKPTINRRFCCFDLNNFAKIIQGCTALRKEIIDHNKKFHLKIWVHELLRVFSDRMSHEDKSLLLSEIATCIDEQLKEDCKQIFENLVTGENDQFSSDNLSRLLCGSYSPNNSAFDEITIKQLQEIIDSTLGNYNGLHSNKVELVTFDWVVDHFSRICRVLTLPKTNLLQLALPGAGRESLTRLVCHMTEKKFFTPKFTLNYNFQTWRQDVKECMKEAGGFGKPCIFLVKEQFFKTEEFREDIDYLLKTGQVLDPYGLNEKLDMIDLVRTALQGGNPNVQIDPDLVLLYFQKLCLENMHIVLCFSPTSDVFRKTHQYYPAIVSHCEVDYFETWPQEAFECIGKTWTENLSFDKDMKANIVSALTYFHRLIINQSHRVPITTNSYFDFVKLYYELVTLRKKEISATRQRYQAALRKLSFAASQICEMQKSLAEYQPQLEAMTAQASEMTEQIAKETIEVERASSLVRQDEQVANEQAAAAQILKLDCEADLAQAIPILEDAIQALNTLKPTDITLVKSMKNPPDAIKLVMAAVCVIKDVKPDRIPDPSTGRKTIDYWGPSKRILGDMNFLQTLKEFDKDHIKPEIMVKIRRDYLPHKDFKPHVVAKASSAAEGLCKWIIAMDMYDNVAKEVAPKKEKLEKAEKEYSLTVSILNEKKEEVSRIEQKLANLHVLLAEATTKQQKLQRNVDICKRKLSRAQRLIGGLGEEKIRWEKAVEQLDLDMNCLIGDMLICSGTIAYLGPFNSQFRCKVVGSYQDHLSSLNIPHSSDYSLAKNFEQHLNVNKWHLYGLPYDEFFIDGAVIAKFSKRWCFFIDPQNQANEWIKKIEKLNGLGVTKLTVDNYFDLVVEHIKAGTPILIENITTTEPLFISLVHKVCYFQNNTVYMNLLGEVIPCHTKFRLYMTTNDPNLELDSIIHNVTTVIEFSLTTKALTAQLLTNLVEIEKPRLKKLKADINKQTASNKKSLANLEDKILKLLAESQVDILEDEKSLKVLDESKQLSKQIASNQEDLKPLENTSREFRQQYESVASHSTILYFCTFNLSKINPMYRFSLQWYIYLYTEAIQKAHRYRILSERCASLIDTITFQIHNKVVRALFQKDRVLYGLSICLSLLQFEGKFDLTNLEYLLSDNTPYSGTDFSASKPTWLPIKIWNKICYLSEQNFSKDFLGFFIDNADLFERIFLDEVLLEDQRFAEPWHSNITKFFITALLKPDRMYNAATNLIKKELGDKFLQNVPFSIQCSFMDSYILSPIMLIQTPGSDPIPPLLDFAQTKKFKRKLCFTSLENSFQSLIEDAQAQGLWVCIQNCHLYTSKLSELEQLLENVDYDNTHENFRLWISTDESLSLPITLLERCIKVVKEPSDQIREKMLDLYSNSPITNPEFYEGCPGKHDIFSKLLYNIAFFHCAVLHRQNYGPFKWNTSYLFSENDFKISASHLQIVINQNNDPIKELKFFVGESNYGGYISNKWDRNLLTCLLDDFVNDSGNDLPIKTDHQDYVQHIMKLPDIEHLETFGLHNSCALFENRERSLNIRLSLSKLFISAKHPRTGDKFLCQILAELSSKVPKPLHVPELIFDSFPLALDVVIKREVKRYNKLLELITRTLQKLQKAVEGLEMMTEDSLQSIDAILRNKVPQIWTKLSYPNLFNLSTYIKDLNQRIDYFSNFQSNYTQNIFLANFYIPKSFLMVLKSSFYRANGLESSATISDIKFKFCSSSDPGSITLKKTYLTGATFNKNECRLDELNPKILYDSMESFAVTPFYVKADNTEIFYECPIYRILGCLNSSVNFVEVVLLKTEKSSKHWTKRSVCIFCQVEDDAS